VLSLSLSLATAAPASAVHWSMEPTGVPAGTRAAVLNAVSCPRIACTAVGYVTGRGGVGATLAEQRTGSRWSLQPTPLLSGARAALLFGVSCHSATACTAVGSATGSSGRTRPLTERLDGSSWSVQRTPLLSAAVAYLAGVSCGSVDVCVAVGYAGNRPGTAGVALAQRWDGHRWAVQRTVRPAGARASFLSGVSCTGPRTCTAVGFSNEANGTQAPLAERWNGRQWSLEPMPHVPGQLDTQLAGVACAGERSCTAVGFFTNVTGVDVMLAEHWNGTRWAQQRPRYPRGARHVRFSAVSCPSAASCTAVGVFNDPQGADAILAERSNGGRWTIERTPTAAGLSSRSLNGVSCVSARTCTAVGNSPGRPLVVAQSSSSRSATVPATRRTISPGAVIRAGEGSAAARAPIRLRSSRARLPATTVLPARPPRAHA
jgi:hypothetical protein